MRIVCSPLFALSIAYAVSGCKPAGSTVQSLDEFGSGDALIGKSCTSSNLLDDDELEKIVVEYATNQTKNCLEIKKSPQDKISIDNQPFCAAAQSSFAVFEKDGIRKMYFKTFGLSVKLSNMTNSYCGNQFSDEKSPQFAPESERRKIEGCVFYGTNAQEAKANNAPQVGVTANKNPLYMAIFMPLNKEIIQRNTIRIMGMFITQFLPKMSKSGNSILFDKSRPDNDQMKTYKYDVADRLLKDLYLLETGVVSSSSDGRKFSLDKLSKVLGSDNVNTLRKKLAALKISKDLDPKNEKLDLKDVFDQLLASDGIKFQRFLGIAMAEAFDSGTCSTQTKEVAAKLFPKTIYYYNANTKRGIEGFINTINATSLALDGSNSAPSAGDNSFGIVASDPMSLLLQASLLQSYGMPYSGSNGIGMNPYLGSTTNPYLGSNVNPYLGSTANPYLGSNVNPYLGSTTNPYLGSNMNPYLGSTMNPYMGSTLGVNPLGATGFPYNPSSALAGISLSNLMGSLGRPGIGSGATSSSSDETDGGCE